MKFKPTSNFNGTSLRGYVETDYQRLVEVLGEPCHGPDDLTGDKVTCEWSVEFEDGVVATVYDWKTYTGTPKTKYRWHIGGYTGESACTNMQSLFPDLIVESAY